VIEMEPTAGRFRSMSRLPQYLMSAMFGWAIADARMCEDSFGIVDQRSRIIAQQELREAA